MKLAIFMKQVSFSLFSEQVSFIYSLNDDVIIDEHMSAKTTDRK
jgi:hypothetical protein